MPHSSPYPLEGIYPLCRVLLGTRRWRRLAELCRKPSALPGILEGKHRAGSMPLFVSDLARLEWAVHEVEKEDIPGRHTLDRLTLNPALRLLSLKWKGIPAWMNDDRKSAETPKRGSEVVLVWRRPESGTVIARKAFEEDLLVLKMTIEGIAAGGGGRDGVDPCRRRGRGPPAGR